MGSFTSGLSGLANIPDSFSSRVTSSIKDQLHTLVEEEEEEPVASFIFIATFGFAKRVARGYWFTFPGSPSPRWPLPPPAFAQPR